MSLFYPGRVSNSALLAARVNNTRGAWDWMRDSNNFPYDQDITGSYYDSLLGHTLHSLTGIHTALVLWGDSQWFTQLANNEVYQLVSKLVHSLKTSQEHTVRKLIFSTYIYDCSKGEMHDVAKRELISTETAMLQQCLPAADTRSVLIVKLLMQVNECECSISFVVPPPYDNCSWDVHAYMRSADETVLTTNSLWATVFHIGGNDRPNDEVLKTLQRMRLKMCSPIPNTQAAVNLMATMKAHQESPPAAVGGSAWSKQRSEELLEELRAMEGELVSVRAAYVAANQRCDALEAELGRQTGPETLAKIPLDPAAVQREQLRVSEELLRRLNVDYGDLTRRLSLIEKAVGSSADLRLRALLMWRQEECEILLQRLSESHLRFVSGQNPRTMPNSLAIDNRATSMGAPSSGVTPSMQKAIQEAEQLSGNGPKPAGQRNAAMNQTGAGNGGHMTYGSSTHVDPIVILYQGRLVELENEVAKMTDVDVKACVDEYYIKELARMEAELVDWITKYRVAESKREVAEQALKMR